MNFPVRSLQCYLIGSDVPWFSRWTHSVHPGRSVDDNPMDLIVLPTFPWQHMAAGAIDSLVIDTEGNMIGLHSMQ